MIFFSIHLPSVDIPEAGQKICHRHLFDCIKTTKVNLISFVNEIERLYLSENEFHECESCAFFYISNFKRIINLIKNPFLPLDVAVRADHRILKKINKKLRDEEHGSIFIEYEQGAFVLPFITKKVKSTVVFHDVISQSIRRRYESFGKLSLKRLFFRLQLKLCLDWERKLAKCIDQAIVLNEKDKILLENIGFDSSRIKVEYPTVSEKFYAASRDKYEQYTILFWGAMNRTENQDAVIWFVSSILPKIKESIPKIQLIVLGANPTSDIMSLASDNIVVTGFVDDPIPYFEKAALAVAPLRFGAGIKLKVLEAIAAKLPVIGTSVAAEGVNIKSNELIVCDDENDFAQAVIKTISAKHHS